MIIGRAALLILAASVAGCGADGRGAEEFPELVVTRSTEFGDPDGEGALSSVWGVAVSGGGHVYLSEPQFARVVAFDPQGSFSRVVGTRGDGPGELGIPGLLSWRGDSLAVTDFQRGIHPFSSDGGFGTLVSFNVSDGASPFGVRPIFPLADGSVAALAPAPNSAITDGTVTRETWLKASRDGAVTDTLAVLDLEGRLYSVRYRERGRSGAHPLAWAPLLTAPPGGTSLIVVDRHPHAEGEIPTYRVLRLGLDGDTLGTAAVRYDPLPLTAGQVDSIAAVMAQAWAESMNATVASLAREIEGQVRWPEHQPPVTSVLAGDDGSVWLRREIAGAPTARWDVLDRDLSPLGRVDLPVELELKVVGKERVYGVELGELDVPRIVRLDVGGRR